MARMMLKELDKITETVKDWFENQEPDTVENNKKLCVCFRPSQWSLLTYSLNLAAATVGSKIPSEIHKTLSNVNTPSFYYGSLENKDSKLFRTILDTAAKYWLPLSDNFKLGYAALANLIGLECLSDEFRYEDKIAKKFFQGVTGEDFNDEKLKIYLKDMAIISTAMPLFLKYQNGFLRLLMGVDYLNAILKQNPNIRYNRAKWSGNFEGEYKNLVWGMQLGKVIAVQDMIHADFGCRQGRSNSFADELDIIKCYRTFFQKSAEQGGYATNHHIPYDKEILTEFFNYPKSIRGSFLQSKLFN